MRPNERKLAGSDPAIQRLKQIKLQEVIMRNILKLVQHSLLGGTFLPIQSFIGGRVGGSSGAMPHGRDPARKITPDAF